MRRSFTAAAAMAACLATAPVAHAATISATPSDDAWVRASSPSSNLGADDELWNQSSPVERGYLKFRVSGVPAGSTITGVRLVVRTSGKSHSGSANGPAVQATSTGWSEGTLTYGNAPAATSGTLANVASVGSTSTVTYNLPASAVRGDGTYAFLLAAESTDDTGYFSSEGATPPRLEVDYGGTTPPPPPPPPTTECSDGVDNADREDTVVDLADPGCSDGRDNDETDPAPPPPPPPPPANGPAIPANAELVYSSDFNGVFSGLGQQCAHSIPFATENGVSYARFVVNPNDAQVAGGERCEVSRGSGLTKGEWWFQTRMRQPVGYPGSEWSTIEQWHESGGSGAVYLARFVNRGQLGAGLGPVGVDGQFVPFVGSEIDLRQWHTYTAHVNFQANGSGYAETWIDGTYQGRTSGQNAASGENYWKGGVYRGRAQDHAMENQIDFTRHYRVR